MADAAADTETGSLFYPNWEELAARTTEGARTLQPGGARKQAAFPRIQHRCADTRPAADDLRADRGAPCLLLLPDDLPLLLCFGQRLNQRLLKRNSTWTETQFAAVVLAIEESREKYWPLSREELIPLIERTRRNERTLNPPLIDALMLMRTGRKITDRSIVNEINRRPAPLTAPHKSRYTDRMSSAASHHGPLPLTGLLMLRGG